MAAKLSEGLGEQVTCPICLEHYSDPRLLPCLHTYCRQCLQDLLAKGKRKVSVICPECREEVQIISGDVTKLQVDFWINNLLLLLAIHSTDEKDGGNTELTCENCDSKAAAKGRCVNCCMFLCNVCFTAHQRLLTLKDHQLITLDELKDTGIPVIEKRLFCEKHKGEVKRLFCNTCQDLICRDCTIIDHRDHQFSFMEDVVDQHKQLFKTEVERASNKKKTIEAILKLVQEIKENVEETTKVTEEDIDNLIDKQIRALEEKRASLKETTKKIAATKMKKLVAQEDGLTMHLTGLKSAIEFTGKVLTNGGSSDVLSLSKQLTSRLSQLSKDPFLEDLCFSWRKETTRLEFNENLFLKSINCVKVVEVTLLVDYSKCSVGQLIGGRFYIKRDIRVRQGQVLEFVVQIKNSFGEKMKIMPCRIQATIYTEGLGGEPMVLPIRRLQDDTYSFQVTLKFDFLMFWANIEVMVDGTNILGSPIHIFS